MGRSVHIYERRASRYGRLCDLSFFNFNLLILLISLMIIESNLSKIVIKLDIQTMDKRYADLYA